ncbi:hypothetical protein BACERE00185_02433 [Bacillus mobilis]|uniref:Uncharacterized protein n=1 Tax=Bacillus mobilis TaxID=2026190 RepID=A0A1Y5ZP11_9BACI|nr:hypothetical protein BACERE00185_02433 [Bacillus mobilis]
MQCLQYFLIPRCNPYGNYYYEQQCISIPCITRPVSPIPEPGPVEMFSTSPLNPTLAGPICFAYCMYITRGDFYICENMCGKTYYQ